MLLNHSDRFQAVDLRKRVFGKVAPGPQVTGEPGSWTEPVGRELVPGPGRLADLLVQDPARPAADIVQAIQDGVAAFCGEEPQPGDVTVLAVRAGSIPLPDLPPD